MIKKFGTLVDLDEMEESILKQFLNRSNDENDNKENEMRTLLLRVLHYHVNYLIKTKLFLLMIISLFVETIGIQRKGITKSETITYRKT